MVVLLPFLLACSDVPPAPPATLLVRHPERLTDLQLPASSLPAPLPREVPITGPFERREDATKGVEEYAATLPVRQVGRGFDANRRPEDLEVTGPDGREALWVKPRASRRGAGTWGLADRGSRSDVILRVEAGSGPPEPGSWTVRFAPALEAEEALNLDTSGEEDRAFALRSVRLEGTTRHGLFLPAPASSTWDLDVPASSDVVLAFDAMLLPPVVDTGTTSDGASVVVESLTEAGTRALARVDLAPEDREPVRIPLADFAGESLQLRIRSEAGPQPWLDYVFLAEPTLYVPQDHPRRLLLVFIDTLRTDHMDLYGYARDTMPRLAEWAGDAVVFDQARAPAPWTLPSARALLSGRQPEHWEDGASLPEVLGEHGWTTGAFVANAYLSHAFGMTDGWSHHHFDHLVNADVQVATALDWLDERADRDTALMVQFMDSHVPYKEPQAYRHLWAGDPPDGLDGWIGRGKMLALGDDPTDEQRAYIADRYDQNLRHVDDQLADLLEAVGDRASVVVFADHGEEFWDHGRVEHGQSVWDELIHVPLIIKAPGLEPRREPTPVSLTRLAPTALDLAGVDSTLLDGDSLLDGPLAPELQAFGRTLYNDEAWGAIDGHRKWVSSDGDLLTVDLAEDPRERHPAPGDPEVFRSKLAHALGVDVAEVWRVELPGTHRSSTSPSMQVELRHPDGFVGAWTRFDPVDKLAHPRVEEGRVTIARDPGEALPREVFVQPRGSLDGLQVQVTNGPSVLEGTCCEEGALELGHGYRAVHVSRVMAPVMEVAATPDLDGETRSALEELGYIDGD